MDNRTPLVDRSGHTHGVRDRDSPDGIAAG
jgi:hypothetical protein